MKETTTDKFLFDMMPSVLKKPRKLCYFYFHNSLPSSTCTVLVNVYTFKILNLLCQKMSDIVHTTDLENDLDKIYLWVAFFTAYLY